MHVGEGTAPRDAPMSDRYSVGFDCVLDALPVAFRRKKIHRFCGNVSDPDVKIQSMAKVLVKKGNINHFFISVACVN